MRKIWLFILIFALVSSFSLAEGIDISNVDVHVDYDDAYTYKFQKRSKRVDASFDLRDNSRINAEIYPGSNVTFTISLLSTLPLKSSDLKGSFARATIEEIDDGSDLEEESIDLRLEPGDEEKVDVKFNIPAYADSGTYNVIIEAEAEARNNTVYTDIMNLKLEVRKLAHDIRITKVYLDPSIIDCSRKVKVIAEISNLGSNFEDQLALEIKALNLGLNSYDKNLMLGNANDEEIKSSYEKSATLDVPKFFDAGSYPIYVNLYWKNFVLFDQKIVQLNVKDCLSQQNQNYTEEIVDVNITKSDNLNESSFEAPFYESANSLAIVFFVFLGAALAAAVIIFVIIRKIL